MTLDLNALAVDSFNTVDGDPTQWLLAPPEPTDLCDLQLAPTYPYESCGCVDD